MTNPIICYSLKVPGGLQNQTLGTRYPLTAESDESAPPVPFLPTSTRPHRPGKEIKSEMATWSCPYPLFFLPSHKDGVFCTLTGQSLDPWDFHQWEKKKKKSAAVLQNDKGDGGIFLHEPFRKLYDKFGAIEILHFDKEWILFGGGYRISPCKYCVAILSYTHCITKKCSK